MKVDNFRSYTIYQRSLDLMLAIYNLIDHHGIERYDQDAKELYKTAIKIPKLIAGAIGQTNMKVRFKKLNEVKRLLESDFISNQLKNNCLYDRNLFRNIDKNRVQVLKLLNAYFRWMKQNKEVG